MNQYLILCVDDEREILDSVIHDLEPLDEFFVLEAAESVSEAKEIIEENANHGINLALILCDHIMPKHSGIDFLIELNHSDETTHARKVLLTGQAGLEDTIQAINQANLDFYISKPWQGEDLLNTITQQLTQFIIENDTELLPWVRILNGEEILEAIAAKRTEFGE
ncbi:putative TWO-COMPONENT SYSTEM SENSOR HISTIDINE KINASE/RESPONSE REGULATOR [Vibrio nigripulchritudo SOn1]|uniref:TWO-COMPONENT SYSTEM SENSOR HISTIDINE KINASE/RESPONSE REGULATOR n=1 Tax=Vibrio nigripulchritudo SOn1 TaxID=1238450 RepID=A0AAV2VZU0_9VIBR|nr:response regulator [Vibrio nigripulchritudo]CCO50020.1 putative TWO-COMPONENT SYSTEM SENSOR HISTIDINE KINASE/RESPONSE REGULATOR [Vibrio nigripulchritudo SOn1]